MAIVLFVYRLESFRFGRAGTYLVEISPTGAPVTHRPGDSFIRQRCNQCGCIVPTYYCKATDEYLCESCFEFAVEMVERNDDAVKSY